MNMRRRSGRAPKRRRNVVKVYNRKRRRNPAVFGDMQRLLVRSAWAVGGGVATRSVPQAVLGMRNTGVLGYAANLLTAAGGAALVGKLSKSTEAAESFLLGGFVMTAGRVVEDWFGQKVVEFAQVGLPLPQLGAGDPAFDFRMAGDFINQGFPLPYSSLASGRLALPSPEMAAVANGGGNGARLSADPTWTTPWN